MKLSLERKWKKDNYTIGNLYIDGKFFCNTIEDKDRGINQNMPLSEIQKIKVYGQTAIPSGIYPVIINMSAKFKKLMPLLINVPGFSGVRIHAGNTAEDSLGCILVGENKVKGKVINSRVTFEKLMKIISNQSNLQIEIN